jgi:hypothetical protein
MSRIHSRIDILCERWRIVQHPGSLSAYKLVEPIIDDFLPWDDRLEPLIPEARAREAFTFVDRFTRQHDFAAIDPDKLGAVRAIVLGSMKDGSLDEATFDDAWPLMFPDRPAPDDYYAWAAQELGLQLDRQFDADIRHLAHYWGDDDDGTGLAYRLYCTVEAVQWGFWQPK